MNKQKKLYTWETILEYIKCPKCGWILEDRQLYKSFFGKPYKQLQCLQCQHQWMVEKKKSQRFGPLFGEATPTTVEWF